MPRHNAPEPLLTYAISDRSALHGENLPEFVGRAALAGIDFVQIREKDLSDRALFHLVEETVRAVQGTACRVLVNDRMDIAVAAGAHGLHLGGHSLPAERVRRHLPRHFVIGVSTHSPVEAQAAAAAGADFISFGPVFATASKAKYGPPVGVTALSEICRAVDLPVFPLGGIRAENLAELLTLPIAGIAAISLFQNAPDLATMVKTIQNREIPST